MCACVNTHRHVHSLSEHSVMVYVKGDKWLLLVRQESQKGVEKFWKKCNRTSVVGWEL